MTNLKAEEKKQNNTKITLDCKMAQSEENRHIILREGIIRLNYIKFHFCKPQIIESSKFHTIQSDIKSRKKNIQLYLETKMKEIEAKSQ